MKTFLRVALVVAILGSSAARAWAQADFGSIKGYVTDESGAALPGVTVTVKSVALQGERSMVTDSEGFYRILNLPPGEYALTAELSGFSKQERPGITMRAGLNLAVDLKMKIGQVTEVVQVTAEAPLLEAEKTDRRINIDGDFLRALPLTAGHDWWDALKVVPGVLILGGTGGTLESRGAGLSSNVFTLDGIDVSDVQQNAAGGTRLPLDSVADIKVSTTGQDAASRMAVGAHLSIVTRSGSNNLTGSFTADLQPKKLNDSNVPGGSPADQTIYQYSPSIGGPILRDRLWYFGSYRYLSQEFGIARSAAQIAALKAVVPSFEPFNRFLPTHDLFIKGTYQLTRDDQLTPSYQYNRTLTVNNANDPTWTEERALGQYSGGPLYALAYSRVFGSRATLQAQAGGYSKPFEVQPQGTGPNVIYYNTAVLNAGNLVGNTLLANTGNVQSVNRSEQRRATVNVDFTYFADKLMGTHEFKGGVNLTPLHQYTFVNTSSNDGFILEDRVLLTAGNPAGGSRPFRRRYEDPIRLDGVGKDANNYGIYVQDSWRPGQRWVVNLGVRFDKVQTYDTWGDPIQASWQVGPRLGAVYRVTEDGKNILRGSYNKMYDATNLLFVFSEGALRKGAIDRYDIDGDGVFEREVVAFTPILTKPAPAANANRGIIDEDLRNPQTVEFTAGYSRQLPWKLAADVTYVHRSYKDKLVAYDTNGIYENGQFLGYRDPNYNQIYEVTNGTANWLVYNGFDLTIHKTLSNNLQVLAGYSYANLRMDGTYDPQDPAGILQPSTFPISTGLGRTVNPASAQFSSYTTASYVNTGTPPHNFKIHATYVAPWDITLGLSYLYQMGQFSGPIYTLIPQSASPHPVNVTLSNGRSVPNPLATRTRFYYPTRDEGQFTAPALSEINMRAGKVFKINRVSFEAAVQTFNLINRGEDLFFNAPTLVEGQPSTFTRRLTQTPRAGQITLRMSF